MSVAGRKMQERCCLERLPSLIEEKLALPGKDLDHRAPLAAVASQFLPFAKRKENDPYSRRIEHRSTNNTGGSREGGSRKIQASGLG